ncbi:MAG: bifunctional UDP-N-acetylglucosamine diphosphorylase/glucosamine-1-phosphate N-acetyltransferase GlmU, partial [Propionibacteriaceae bacterium]
VNIADGAYVAAGSALTGDVDPGQLAVSRARQRNIDGWVQRKRAGTQTASAAERAINECRTNDPGDESEPSR